MSSAKRKDSRSAGSYLTYCLVRAYDMVMLSPKEIRDLRNALGLTCPELAEKVGVCEDTIWKWERGDRHPNYKRMQKLNELRDDFIRRTLQPA